MSLISIKERYRQGLYYLFIVPCVIICASPASIAAEVSAADIALMAPPETTQIMPAKKGMQELISLDLRGIDITDALKYIALKANINVVVSKTTTGKVTLVVRDVPLIDAFDIILRSNDLAYEKRGDIYYVLPETEYKKIYGKNFFDVRIVRAYRLKYAIPEQAFNFIDALKSDVGRVVVDQESGTVVVLDTPESIKEIEKAIAALEQRNSVEIFNLQYAKARDVEDHLKEQLNLKNLGSIRADERSNQVVVYTLPEKMKEIETVISALDKKSKQVFISVLLIKVTLTDGFDSGVDWEIMLNKFTEYLKRYTGSGLIGMHGGMNFTAALPINTLITDSGTLTVGTFEDSYNLILNFLKTVGETKVIANPKISVVNKQEATIHVGRQLAYVTTTTTTGTTTQTTAEEVTFVPVGFSLSVTPTINDEGYISMKIKPHLSSQVDKYETPTGNVIPIIDESEAETTVLVRDNSTIIIGGLRNEQKAMTHKKIPFLGDIPIIGEVFKSRDDDSRSADLLIIITPTIVEGDRLVTGEKSMDDKDMGFVQYRDYKLFEFDDVFDTPGTEPAIKPLSRIKDDFIDEKRLDEEAIEFAPYKEYEDNRSEEGPDLSNIQPKDESTDKKTMKFVSYKEY